VFVSPEQIIEMLDLAPPMVVADFGCGSGHYVIGAAKKVGKSGKVYAIDIQQEMLSFVRSQAQMVGLNNVETIWTDLEMPNATRLKENTVDLIIISNILFQAEDKNQVLKEALRILKTGGRMVVIEWNIEEQGSKLGPIMDARISPQDAKTIFEGAGFSFVKEFDPGEHHYGLIFKK
jgi:ubiquinone/menaquinone biosynthesis C-methylase UbiE